jgi:hypothetical protein
VLVKPNFNSPDSFPAPTEWAFLLVVIELIAFEEYRGNIKMVFDNLPTKWTYRMPL